MRVFVIGGSGLVGHNVVNVCEAAGFAVQAASRTSGAVQFDKADRGAALDPIADFDPDVVVDTAAFHAVDECESERDRAWMVNAAGTRNAAVAATEHGAHFIYLSTDYVFEGEPTEAPYSEDDPVAPCNYYAQTKYAGEQSAKIADDWTVLRPSVIYGLGSDNFATWVLGELEAGNEVRIVDDQVSRPTYAPDLAELCIAIARDGVTGLYHSAGPVSLSRYEFSMKLVDVFGYDPELVFPIRTSELGQEARRPTDSSLDSSLIGDRVDLSMRPPSEAFEHMVKSKADHD